MYPSVGMLATLYFLEVFYRQFRLLRENLNLGLDELVPHEYRSQGPQVPSYPPSKADSQFLGPVPKFVIPANAGIQKQAIIA